MNRGEQPIEGLGGCALYLEQLYRERLGLEVSVSVWAVLRLVKVHHLPAAHRMGSSRRLFSPSAVAAWFDDRAKGVQLLLFPQAAQAAQAAQRAQGPQTAQR